MNKAGLTVAELRAKNLELFGTTDPKCPAIKRDGNVCGKRGGWGVHGECAKHGMILRDW